MSHENWFHRVHVPGLRQHDPARPDYEEFLLQLASQVTERFAPSWHAMIINAFSEPRSPDGVFGRVCWITDFCASPGCS